MNNQSMVIHDILLTYRPHLQIWIAVLGEDYVVHFNCPSSSYWRVYKPMSIEPLFVCKTLNECVLKVKTMYEKRQQESKNRIKIILENFAI